jgi:hypothetical protein
LGGIYWIDLAQDRASGGLLWTQQWSFGFHKMLGNSWEAAQLPASKEGLISMELVFISVFGNGTPNWNCNKAIDRPNKWFQFEEVWRQVVGKNK